MQELEIELGIKTIWPFHPEADLVSLIYHTTRFDIIRQRCQVNTIVNVYSINSKDTRQSPSKQSLSQQSGFKRLAEGACQCIKTGQNGLASSKVHGFETVAIDAAKDMINVKGAMDVKELVPLLTKSLNEPSTSSSDQIDDWATPPAVKKEVPALGERYKEG